MSWRGSITQSWTHSLFGSTQNFWNASDVRYYNILDKTRNIYILLYSGSEKSPSQETIVVTAAAAAAKSLQSCPTLCDSTDCSPPGSAVPGILQAGALEWVAISFSSEWKWKWSRSVISDSSWPHGLQRTWLLHPWDVPGKSTGVGCHCLLRLPF